jgi:flagellar biosynthetic protein FliR
MSDLVCLVAMEIGIGAVLGVGLIAVFSGLRLGGEWIDRHSGLGIMSPVNDEWLSADSPGTSIAILLGIAAMLLLDPVGGQYVILRTLVHSFHSIPAGTAFASVGAIQLLNGLMQESLVLGVRISLPLISMIMLVDVAFAFANRGTSQPLSSLCCVLRTIAGIAFLAITVTRIPDVMATTLMSVQQIFGSTLGF